MHRYTLVLGVLLLTTAGCGSSGGDVTELRTEWEAEYRHNVERTLTLNFDRISAYADSIEAAMRPVPLLTPAQIAVFSRYRNPDQLAAARRLGIAQPLTQQVITQHVENGRLVRLEDNELWGIRELDYSVPLVTPDVEVLLTEIGERFHERLAEHNLPPLRLEITSLLRTAENQEALRLVNPNAAIGESTHQYGTTVDIAYSSFYAPADPVVELNTADAPWLESHLRRVEEMAAETGAARMSRELQAILGHVLREMQNEGKVMVAMEVRQPVYHLTVARRLPAG